MSDVDYALTATSELDVIDPERDAPTELCDVCDRPELAPFLTDGLCEFCLWEHHR